MNSLPQDVCNLIAQFAMPIHPCKNEIETGLVLFHLTSKSPCFDCMSLRTQQYVYADVGLDDFEYKDFEKFDDWMSVCALY